MPTSLRIIWRAVQQWSENKDTRLGAALAYYTIFSIAPLLVVSIYLAGAVFGDEAARGQIATHLEETVGKEAAKTIQDLVDAARRPRAGGWAPAFSIVVLVIGALGVFLHLRAALSTIWKLTPPRGSTILGILLDYVLALVMVFIVGVLLLVSLAMSMAIPLLREMVRGGLADLGGWVDENVPFLSGIVSEELMERGRIWELIEFGVSLLYLTLLFAAIFRVLSGGRIAWRYVWYGSFITAVLFSIGKIALGMYIVYTGAASMYGAASSVVVFMIWVYYSAQILFFGAELVQARRTKSEWMTPKLIKPFDVP